VSGVYLDTSALGRVLLREPDGPAVLRALAEFELHVSSRLLRVELRRLALRHDVLEAASELLAAVALVPVDQATLDDAETVPPASVTTLDAIHLATAIRLQTAGVVDTLITYDARLATGATHHGLAVLAPT
jgi:predicted nucleic acid-binding protein